MSQSLPNHRSLDSEASRDRRVVLVAHRAANFETGHRFADKREDDQLWPAADVVEADVHRFRGRIEVRHSKALWPTSRLFEGRELLPRSASRPSLARVLGCLPDDAELWLDLKGPDPRLGREVDQIVGRRPLWVSARCWWQLAPFRGGNGVQTFMSVGSAWQRPLARACLALGWSDGIVIHERLATDAFLSATARSAPVVAWAVESLERALGLVERGAAGLIVDDPDLIQATRHHIDDRARYNPSTA